MIPYQKLFNFNLDNAEFEYINTPYSNLIDSSWYNNVVEAGSGIHGIRIKSTSNGEARAYLKRALALAVLPPFEADLDGNILTPPDSTPPYPIALKIIVLNYQNNSPYVPLSFGIISGTTLQYGVKIENDSTIRPIVNGSPQAAVPVSDWSGINEIEIRLQKPYPNFQVPEVCQMFFSKRNGDYSLISYTTIYNGSLLNGNYSQKKIALILHSTTTQQYSNVLVDYIRVGAGYNLW